MDGLDWLDCIGLIGWIGFDWLDWFDWLEKRDLYRNPVKKVSAEIAHLVVIIDKNV